MNVDDVYLILHHHWALDTTVFPDGRQRLQLAFLMLLSAYTATRPGALVYVARNVKATKNPYITDDDDSDVDEDLEVKEDSEANDDSELEEDSTGNPMDLGHIANEVKTICYEDVTLTLLPNPSGSRDLLAMEVNLQYTKGHQKRSKR
jgi:hypothetical protein